MASLRPRLPTKKGRQVRQALEPLFDTIEEMVFIVDSQGNVVARTPVVSERLGFTNDELIGRSILDLHPEDGVQGFGPEQQGRPPAWRSPSSPSGPSAR